MWIWPNAVATIHKYVAYNPNSALSAWRLIPSFGLTFDQRLVVDWVHHISPVRHGGSQLFDPAQTVSGRWSVSTGVQQGSVRDVLWLQMAPSHLGTRDGLDGHAGFKKRR